MSQEEKVIEPTVEAAKQAIENGVEELDTESKFYKYMFMGELGLAAITAAVGTTLIIVAKNRMSGDK